MVSLGYNITKCQVQRIKKYIVMHRIKINYNNNNKKMFFYVVAKQIEAQHVNC